MDAVLVRRADPADVAAMSAVLTASIAELCIADHKDDAAFLSRWLSNKTPAGVEAMLANPDITLYVAERAGAIAAVGCIGADGEIGLNYVSPRHRFQGVSKALLAAMEAELKVHGHRDAFLTSTITAHRFYRAAGWSDSEAMGGDGHGHPMAKRL